MRRLQAVIDEAKALQLTYDELRAAGKIDPIVFMETDQATTSSGGDERLVR